MNTTLLTQNLAHGKMLFPRVGIGILLMTLAFSSVAQASDSAPNDATIQGSSQVVNGSISSTPKLYYTISEMPGYTSAWNTHVAVYYDSASDANTDKISLQKPSDGDAGRNSIKVKVVVGGISVNTDGNSGYRTYKYNSISNAEYDSSTGKFKRSVEVSRISGNGHFRFSVVSDKGIVRSIATGVMGYETNYTMNKFEVYSDYKLNFGSPCGVPSGGAWQQITLTDPDNKDSRVKNGGAQRRPFTVFVKAQLRNLAGDGSPLERGDYTQLKDITWSGSSSQLSPTYINETNSSFSILMKPNMKYAFYINGMDNNNTIQVTLPTDEVYHDITCKWWQDSATSRVVVNPTGSTNSWNTYTETRDTANVVGDRLYFAHQITDPDITRTNYELLVQKQQWWTTNPSSASSGTTGSPTNWNPPGITLDNAFIYNRWWGNDYYYLVKNSVNNGNIKGNPYTIKATDMNNHMGSYLCERIAAFPKAGHISGITKTWVFSDPACVMLKFNYSLVPSVTMNQTYINPGGSVSGLGASVRNSAPKPTNSPIANAVVRFVVPKAGGSLAKTTSGETSIGNNNDFGCQIAKMMANGMQAGSCKYFRNDSAGFVMRPGVNTLSLTAGTTDDLSGLNLKSGDKVCYFTVINKYEEDKSGKDWRYSAPRCAVVAAIPTVNVWGNDVRVGSSYKDTQSSSRNSKIQGGLREK